MTPAGTSNELDVQNGWEENTHTHIKFDFTVEKEKERLNLSREILSLQPMFPPKPLDTTVPLEVDAQKI